MNLNKHDPETDMEMNMTPMIDVVFLLIIFFMVITDLTQQDLEELTLPVAENAVDDKPAPDDFRPVLNILIDGTIMAKRVKYYDPEDPNDQYSKVKELLAEYALRMKLEPFDENKPGVNMIPGEALLIRADENTPFKYVQKVMELCGLEGVRIWKVQLAATEASPDENGGIQ